jgi:hypothetical protein
LVSFLKTLDFVEKITSADLPVVKPGIEEQDTGFFYSFRYLGKMGYYA